MGEYRSDGARKIKGVNLAMINEMIVERVSDLIL
jgi:hypothetical protein